MTLRKRGRPSGSSRLNQADEIAMARMADVMLSAPSITPTAAMRRAGITDDSHQRRMRRKWKDSSERHLEAAQRRKDESQQRSTPTNYQPVGISGHFHHYSSLSEAVSRINDRMERAMRLQEKIDQQVKMHERINRQIKMMDEAARIKKIIDQMGGQSAVQRIFDDHAKQQRLFNNLSLGKFPY